MAVPIAPLQATNLIVPNAGQVLPTMCLHRLQGISTKQGCLSCNAAHKHGSPLFCMPATYHHLYCLHPWPSTQETTYMFLIFHCRQVTALFQSPAGNYIPTRTTPMAGQIPPITSAACIASQQPPTTMVLCYVHSRLATTHHHGCPEFWGLQQPTTNVVSIASRQPGNPPPTLLSLCRLAPHFQLLFPSVVSNHHPACALALLD